MFVALAGVANSQNDNPYAAFGYKGTVLTTPQERQKVILMIENSDTLSPIRRLGIDPAKHQLYYFSAANALIGMDTLLEEDYARFLSVDPSAKKYPGWSSYHFVADNPIFLIDPDGREWVNPYERMLKKEQALEKPNAKTIAFLTGRMNRVNEALGLLKEKDEELYNYIQNARNDFGKIYVTLHVTDAEEKTNKQALGATIYTEILSNVKGEPMAPNTFDVTIYKEQGFYNKGDGIVRTLANEAGDVMFAMEYPALAKKEKEANEEYYAKYGKVLPYDGSPPSRYSFGVEEAFEERAAGRLKETNIYPLKFTPAGNLTHTKNGTEINNR